MIKTPTHTPEQIIKNNYRPLKRSMHKYLQSKGVFDTEDVISLIFTQILEKNSDRLFTEYDFQGFCIAACKNHAASIHRHYHSSAYLHTCEYKDEHQLSYEDEYFSLDAFSKVLSTLSQPQKEIIYKYYYLNYSTSFLAKDLKIKHSAARVRLHRALKECRKIKEQLKINEFNTSSQI